MEGDISNALDLLRNELTQLQEQDVMLLKQLMSVHYSIQMLKRKLFRRTNSFSTLATSSTLKHHRHKALKEYNSNNIDSETGTGNKNYYSTLPVRSGLSRVMSEPNKFLPLQRSLSTTTEEGDEDDVDGDEEDSADTDPLMSSLNIDPQMSALLTDMPKSLRRRYLKSLNHNSYLLGRLPSTSSTASDTYSSNETKVQQLHQSACKRLSSIAQDENETDNNNGFSEGYYKQQFSAENATLKQQRRPQFGLENDSCASDNGSVDLFAGNANSNSDSNTLKKTDTRRRLKKLCRTNALSDDTVFSKNPGANNNNPSYCRSVVVNEDMGYDSDSSGGIQITAL